MASKGQKFKQYSPELKLMVVEEYNRHEKTLYSLCHLYNISSPETILRWAKSYEAKGLKAFEESRGKATRETSPLKGRPRKKFKDDEEKKEYLRSREEYYKQKALEREEKKHKSNRV